MPHLYYIVVICVTNDSTTQKCYMSIFLTENVIGSPGEDSITSISGGTVVLPSGTEEVTETLPPSQIVCLPPSQTEDDLIEDI